MLVIKSERAFQITVECRCTHYKAIHKAVYKFVIKVFNFWRNRFFEL